MYINELVSKAGLLKRISDALIVVERETSRPKRLISAILLRIITATDHVFYNLIFIKLLNSTPQKLHDQGHWAPKCHGPPCINPHLPG